MDKAIQDKLGIQVDRLVEDAETLLNGLENSELQEWVNSTPTKALILLLESNILSITLAWRVGSIARRAIPTYDDNGRVIIPADPEAESRARHSIDIMDTMLNYITMFDEWHSDIKEEIDNVKTDRS